MSSGKMKVMTLKGIFPDPKPVRRKNFIRENVKNLRRMEQCFQANKEVEELQKLQLHKHHKSASKYRNISARVITNFEEKEHENNSIDTTSKNNIDPALNRESNHEKQKSLNETDMIELDKKHIDNTTKKNANLGINGNVPDKQKRRNRISKQHKNQQKLQTKVLSEPSISHKSDEVGNTIKYKNQGIQTLDTDQTENIYSEGIIRYASKNIIKHDEVASNSDLNQKEEKTFRKQSDSPTDRGDMHTPEDARKLDLRNSDFSTSREETDFVKLNKQRTSVVNKLATQLDNSVLPPSYRKGVVPKYLRERKEAQQREQKAKEEALHHDCPEGHVSLPDQERKETLRLLKKNYQDYINELNKMPIKTDTLRAQRRKIEIEKQLNKLEEGIKVFSRPKVYVKINA